VNAALHKKKTEPFINWWKKVLQQHWLIADLRRTWIFINFTNACLTRIFFFFNANSKKRTVFFYYKKRFYFFFFTGSPMYGTLRVFESCRYVSRAEEARQTSTVVQRDMRTRDSYLLLLYDNKWTREGSSQMQDVDIF